MAAPNAPNPVNPNDPNQDQDQDQAGQVPANVPVNQYCNWSQHNWLLLVSCPFLRLFIKIG